MARKAWMKQTMLHVWPIRKRPEWWVMISKCPWSTSGILFPPLNQSVNCIHLVSQVKNRPSLFGQNDKPAGSGLKTTDPNTYRLVPSVPLLSLSLSLFSQPVIQRSVVQATALVTVTATCRALPGQDESARRGQCKSPLAPHWRFPLKSQA